MQSRSSSYTPVELAGVIGDCFMPIARKVEAEVMEVLIDHLLRTRTRGKIRRLEIVRSDFGYFDVLAPEAFQKIAGNLCPRTSPFAHAMKYAPLFLVKQRIEDIRKVIGVAGRA